MKNKKIFICFLFLFFTGGFLRSQDKADFELVGKLFEVKKSNPKYKHLIKNNSNEIQFVASGLLLFYKSVFSSQDGNHCAFYPSCSIYAIESIKKKGVILGFAAAMDRLSRCNRLSPGNYEKYKDTQLFSDPVD
jgi:uncharacterized protein